MSKQQIRVAGQKVTFTWHPDTRTWSVRLPGTSEVVSGQSPDLDAARDSVRRAIEPDEGNHP
jgi:hypothetical protein